VRLLQHPGLPALRRPNRWLPAGAAGREANLIRVLKATAKGPQRGSQHPAYQRPPTTKEIRRQRATSPIFTQERAPPQGGTEAYQQNAGNRCAKFKCRSPRSLPTVGAEVMCSHGVQLCVLARLLAVVHAILGSR
jgi:hypothetical protein